MQQQIRDLYEATASTFRRLQLVRPGMAEVLDAGMRYKIEKLSGSDPTFATEIVEVDRPAKSNRLAFWMSGTRTMCRAMPFFFVWERRSSHRRLVSMCSTVWKEMASDGFLTKKHANRNSSLSIMN
jgi:hypothetical protein